MYSMYTSYGPAVEGRPPNVTNPASLLIGQPLIQPLSSLVGLPLRWSSSFALPLPIQLFITFLVQRRVNTILKKFELFSKFDAILFSVT